jgi:hypothetical protein
MDATAQKNKVFYKSALEFNFASISGLGVAYFVKKLQNRCTLLFTQSFLFERTVVDKKNTSKIKRVFHVKILPVLF